MSRNVNPSIDVNPSIHHKENLKIAMPYIRGMRVLDIGCWTGIIEKMVASSTKKIVGVDPNNDAVVFAQKHVPNSAFKVASALDLPFRDRSFDTVLLLEVIEHLPQGSESKALSEIWRVLDRNGTLVLSTPNKHTVSILLDPAYFLIKHRHYSFSDLKSLLNNSGFQILKHSYSGGWFFLIKANLELLAKHLFNINLVLPKWYSEATQKEYVRGGFATIHLIAKKK